VVLSPRPTTEAVRVLVADDSGPYRAGIVRELSRQPGLEVVAEATDGASALALAERAAPDVLLLDVRMPGLSGVDVVRRLRERDDDVPIVVLTAVPQFNVLRDVLEAGAHSWLSKASDRERIADALRVAAASRALH
jgi:DNA-binding NarL/FixJ family response regulator